MKCSMRNPERPWLIAIDTGGTFTDGVARTPTGEYRRTKVLSNGSIRARISEVAGPRRCRLDFHGLTIPEGLLAGFTLGSAVSQPSPTVRDMKDGIVELSER